MVIREALAAAVVLLLWAAVPVQSQTLTPGDDTTDPIGGTGPLCDNLCRARFDHFSAAYGTCIRFGTSTCLLCTANGAGCTKTEPTNGATCRPGPQGTFYYYDDACTPVCAGYTRGEATNMSHTGTVLHTTSQHVCQITIQGEEDELPAGYRRGQ